MQAKELYSQLGEQGQVASVLHNFMMTAVDWPEVERHYLEAYALAERIGDAGLQSNLLLHYVEFLEDTHGNYDQGRALLERALALHQEAGDAPYHRSAILLEISEEALHLGDLNGAQERAEEVLDLLESFTTYDAQRYRETAWIQLALVALARGDVQAATEIAERYQGDRHHDEQQRVSALIVRLTLLRGDHEQARTLLFGRGLERLWEGNAMPRHQSSQRVQALLLAADVEIAGGKPNEAWQHLQEALTLTCKLVFVRWALEAFVVAAPLLPSDKAEELLAVAATHSAASFDTQQRARRLMSADPTAMNPSILTTEGVLERALALRKSRFSQ
jgi:tetratricopeptide (TPR) repeat protein